MLGGHLGEEQNWPLWSGEAPSGGLSTCSKRTRHTGGWWGAGSRAARVQARDWNLLDHAQGAVGMTAASWHGQWAVPGGPDLNRTGKGEAELVLGVPTRG